MVRPERFERPTLWFVARYSIQLSYGRTGMNQRLIHTKRRDNTAPIRYRQAHFDN